jgi:hypothetical protein
MTRITVVALAAMDTEVSSYELFYPLYFIDKTNTIIFHVEWNLLNVQPIHISNTQKQIRLVDRINVSVSGIRLDLQRCCTCIRGKCCNRSKTHMRDTTHTAAQLLLCAMYCDLLTKLHSTPAVSNSRDQCSSVLLCLLMQVLYHPTFHYGVRQH